MFWDLVTQYEEGSSGVLHIIENEFLGKGGFGFVCKGELKQEVRLIDTVTHHCMLLLLNSVYYYAIQCIHLILWPDVNTHLT